MAKKTTADESKRQGVGVTRMRSPFTADVPDEYGEAKWLPELRSLPDESLDDQVVDHLNAGGYIPPFHDRKSGKVTKTKE